MSASLVRREHRRCAVIPAQAIGLGGRNRIHLPGLQARFILNRQEEHHEKRRPHAQSGSATCIRDRRTRAGQGTTGCGRKHSAQTTGQGCPTSRVLREMWDPSTVRSAAFQGNWCNVDCRTSTARSHIRKKREIWGTPVPWFAQSAFFRTRATSGAKKKNPIQPAKWIEWGASSQPYLTPAQGW